MFSKIESAAVIGIDALIIQVEADISDGLPLFNMVGYLASEVREAKDRVKTALKNSHFQLPPKHITINLSPADIRKSGTAFDLPIAIAVMAGFGIIPQESTENIIITGELSLDGRVNSIKGVLPIVCAAKNAGYSRCIVPMDNLYEGAVVDGIEVLGAEKLSDVIEYLLGSAELVTETVDVKLLLNRTITSASVDFSDVTGQRLARRAVEVAVSGQHNILLSGPPGAGKTMLARRIPTIMPVMSFEESLELSKIYSISGYLGKDHILVTDRPFRSPHHTITVTALTGGGHIPMPGEISLAACGVLFLDELPEFDRTAIEALRQPLEDKKVTISRLNASYTYPAGFMLAASMNPCPCGYYPDRSRCRCGIGQIEKYRSKISQPILDRIDICIDMKQTEYKELEHTEDNECSALIRERVARVRELQLERFRKENIYFNSQMNSKQVGKYCVLGKEEKLMMEKAFLHLKLSARAYHRVLKVARTIADMEGSERLQTHHLSEALCYKPVDKPIERI